MEYNFDELRNPILERLGFAATYGLTVDELFKFAKETYVKIEVEKSKADAGHTPAPQAQSDAIAADPHLSGAQEISAEPQGPSSDFPPAPQLPPPHVLSETQEWKASLWTWLTSLRDFVVGPEGEGNGLSLAEIEAMPLPPQDEVTPDSDDETEVVHTRSRQKKETVTTLEQTDKASSPAVETSDAVEQTRKTTFQPRVFASHKKIWRTITGHTIDWDRLPLSEFEALCAISAAGRDGIDQPTLIKLTGQDKKSLPRRTYALETKGYIEKRPIVAPRWNTSFLRHKKFVDEELANGTHYSLKILEPISTTDLDLVPGSEFWTGEVIFEDALIQRMIDLCETWGAIIYDDARTKMGITGKKWNMKTFAKRTRMLCAMGIIEKGSFALPGSKKVFNGVLKFLRRPTDDEWKTLIRRSTRELPKQAEPIAQSIESDEANEEDLELDGRQDSTQEHGGLEGADKEAVDGQTENVPDFPEIPNMATSSDELPRANAEIPNEEANGASISKSINMPDAMKDSAVVAVETRTMSAGHTDGEPSTSSQPLPPTTATTDPQHLRKSAGETSTKQQDINQTALPSEQATQASTPANLPKPAKRRGRPPGRKDSAPRAKPSNLGNSIQPNGAPDVTDQAEPSEAMTTRRGRRTKNATFTSYEDLQRQEGVPGIYINPQGSQYSTRKKNVLVAVIKTNLLKTWVPKPAGSVMETPVAESRQNISDAPQGDGGSASVNSVIAGDSLQSPRNNFSTDIPASGPFGNHQSLPSMSQTAVPSIAHDATPIAAFTSPPSNPLLSTQEADGNPTPTIDPIQPKTTNGSHPSATTSNLGLSSSLGTNEIVSGAGTLENSLEIASGLELPGNPNFTLALWNGIPGKLCLTDDKKSVVFFAAETTSSTPTLRSALEMETSSISDFPTVSKSTPSSGEFQITADGQMHVFTISVSDEAFLAANTLRAKIVTALLAQGSEEKKKTPSARASGGGEKSWQCEHCHKRWKNDNGLLYHQTKSRTTCNPNWDPSEPKPASRRASLNPEMANFTQMLGSRRSETNANSISRETSVLGDSGATGEGEQSAPVEGYLEVLDQNAKRKAEDMEDGDFVPDETDKHTTKKRRVNAPDTPSKKIRSKTMNSQASTNADLDVDMDVNMETDIESLAEPVVNKRTKRSKAKGAPVPNSHLALKGIIFDLLEANGGIFPGDQKSVWVAVAWESRKRSPNLGYPEFTKIPAALKSLVDGRRLKKMTSSFRSQSGLMVNIVVLVKSSLQKDSDAIENMKSQIRNAHPNSYIPAPFKPPDSINAELEEMYNGRTEKKEQVGVLTNPYYMSISQPALSNRRRSNTSSSQSYYDGFSAEEDNANNDRSGRGQNDEALQNGSALVEDEDEDSSLEPSLLQDSITDGPKTGEKRKRVKKYARIPRLPEVITFMQSEGDPTWSTHPFGHGARPIYSRPGRRVEGNPATDARLRRLQDGHRPIMEPRIKMIAPTRPSKILSRSLAGTSDQIPPAPKRRKLSNVNSKRDGSGPAGGNSARRGRTSVYPALNPRQRPAGSLPVVIPPVIKQSGPTITFLPPNTHLGDYPMDEAESFNVSDVLGSNSGSHQDPNHLVSGFDVEFTDIQTFHKVEGQYQNVSISEFEKNTCSYTLHDPVVPRAFLLDQLFPKSLQEILSTKKGPPKQPEKTSNPEYAAFSEQVDVVKKWELVNESLLGQGPVPAEINNSINHTLKVLQYPKEPRPATIDWDAGEAFTWFDPPWKSEDNYKSEEKPSPPQYVWTRRKPEHPPRQRRQYMAIKDFKTRKLTHLKSDFESNDDQSGIPVADFVVPKAAKRGKKLIMTLAEENRFVIAQIAVQTIAGGLSKIADGVLIARLFPTYTLSKIRQLWTKIKKSRGKEIAIIETKFQEAFLEAYEDGELPVLDYDDLINYNWSFVVDWYIKKFPVVSGALPDGLPSTRNALLANYEIENMEPTDVWRDLFLEKSNTASRVKRHQVSTQEHLTVPLHSRSSSINPLDEGVVARSVVRAAISTPGETYDQDIANAKLEKIGNAAVTIAKDQLLEKGAIRPKNRGRAVPRQPFLVTETFSKPLVRESIKTTCFPESFKYKQELDEKFRKGARSVKIDRKETDGAFMCITNLLANGRLRLIQSKVPLSKYGLLANSYETNSIDKNQLFFDLDIEATESYIYNDEIIASITDKLDAPHGIGDAIPAWLDINGDLLPDFWRKALKGVLSALALRAGVNVEELTRILKPSLMDWEVRLILEWGVRNGSVVRIGSGCDGWMTGEWWWMFPSL